MAELRILVDAWGQIARIAFARQLEFPESVTDRQKRLWFACKKGASMVVLEALVRMNMYGTALEPLVPIQLRRPTPKGPTGILPVCTWQKIFIGGEQRIRQYPVYGEEPCVLPIKAARDRREHYVRRHRADYRKGKGAFGRIKAVLFIPAHKRGNPELGCVIPRIAMKA